MSPADSDAYYSVWCDYGMTDPATGKYSPHKPVGIETAEGRKFQLPDNYIEIIKNGVERYTKIRDTEEGRTSEAIESYLQNSVKDGKLTQEQADQLRGEINALGGKPEGKGEYSIVGKRGAEALDRAEERTIRMDNLSTAREMESSGRDARAIRLATGWERGADGKWRYEIEDIKFKPYEEWLESKKKLKLGDVVDNNHPLFTAYPDLLDINIKKGTSKTDFGGWYDHAANEMQLPFGAMKKLGIEKINTYEVYANDVTRTLLHEVQHAIQEREGFASGGSYESLYPDAPVERIEQLRQESDALIDKYNSLSPEERGSAEGRALRREAERARMRYDSLYEAHSVGKWGYPKIAGEVESRNVEKRRNLTPEQRREQLLADTEDVARKDQIFLMGEGDPEAQYSVKRIKKEKNNWTGGAIAYVAPGVELSSVEKSLLSEAAQKEFYNTLIPQHYYKIFFLST